MNTPPPIIAGIDFSDSSPLVLRHAIHAASLLGTSVLAIHVFPSSGLAERRASGYRVADSSAIQAEGLKKLEALIGTEKHAVEIRPEVRIGRPVDTLNQVIEENQADLLLIAANDLTKKRLGSIASQCVRTAPCDVLVLRDWQGCNFSKILVCVDFSTSSGIALERAALLAQEHEAKLEIVHVMYPPEMDEWGMVLSHREESPLSYTEECNKETAERMKAFLLRHADSLAQVSYETLILESAHTATALTNHVLTNGADLVVLGTRGHSRLAGFFLGTNAERLLHDAPVSVLAVRGQ
ncbi:universal stress protein [Roseibacillus persicicus]|uniref:universal stress protein n=1 Tax=Roseibacillus persicicus TaxID=454148 RepID=UPI00280E299C|nr:universal stress protein [Roseibacillus persicicus]MDQ8188993.1 universal stress protein [Roseibacillus persicicus]